MILYRAAQMAKTIRFRFAPQKAYTAILWMISEKPNIDLHTMLKACYFADKRHLNEHGRPVFGATYKAMKFGPVPLEIYEMAKGEPLWLPELDVDVYPWALNGYRLYLTNNDFPAQDALSESDREALEEGFRTSGGMNFNARTAVTHGIDWQKAKLGRMKYEDMFEDVVGSAEKIAYLKESAPFIRI